MVKTSDNVIGGDGNPFTYVDTPTIYSTRGATVAVGESMVPTVSDQYNLGTVSKPWYAMFCSYGYCTERLTTKGIVATGDLLSLLSHTAPGLDNLRDFGSPVKRWASGHFTVGNFTQVNTTNLNSTNVVSSVDLNLSAGTGRDIICNKSVLPNNDNAHTLGNDSAGWRQIYTYEIVSPDILTMSFLNIKLTIIDATIRPYSPGIFDLGSDAAYWRDIYARDVYIQENRIFKQFNVPTYPITLPANPTNYIKIPIFLGSGPFDGGNNEITFPSPGVYELSFLSRADVNPGGASNYLNYQLQIVSGPPPITIINLTERHIVGGVGAYSQAQRFVYKFSVDSIVNYLSIWVKNFDQSVTGFNILEASITRIGGTHMD